ncbi:UDP-N-acetylmuramoyl-L-alanyl-D-glutamate--2,6-diaminopimelate ligase [Roseococcus sp. SYP-B2431]|uniref:UDP-N-acetylmuramoyl-L-alanyl-D-glutamate--2, 6-diaminopimelate ligase n=1 Tax=Roseococcus sp. SYP-B2431 TaxID=2496640 RepID=UPI001040A0CC|nr:UDP-N-acetylmuramoyl-L-alanyl-D-glutamate--2,6-diaminopimelate ligase [Roseococcus sp. SYP-B2431]TCH97504.1 UDP-N-acetylmuramoyl-L-alanyl-D-glutamate--2,6-diaminopimelate ligase [Roseococcus sp. SYP-B2431]
MRLDELRAPCPRLSGSGSAEIRGITADSRAVRPGFLFAALPGAKADGTRFIADAVKAGAAAVLAPEGTEWPAEVPERPLLRAADPRRALALMAAAFHGAQPERIVAITGTNGKTSTADFHRQLMALAGRRAASLGTLGLIAEGFPVGPSLTTPDPVSLHAQLAALAQAGVTDLAMEASSHGLDQRRLDGAKLAAGAFTNLTRDHLDYHGDMAGYRAAKLRLFDRLLPAGATAVLHADMESGTLEALRGIVAARGLRGIEVGEAGRDIRLISQRALPAGQVVELDAFGRRESVTLALPGRFQADNALVAMGLAAGLGVDALALLPRLAGVRGRMELAATLPNGAAVYVDYAHTPDALARLLAALRPHVAPGAKLHVLFGAGGDRDPGKRPLMGAAAAESADVLWVTDDNPRSEDPAAIRAAILGAAIPSATAARDAGEREGAIAAALSALRPGDVLAVAGKGHESGQTIAGVTTPFDDAEVVRRLAGIAA